MREASIPACPSRQPKICAAAAKRERRGRIPHLRRAIAQASGVLAGGFALYTLEHNADRIKMSMWPDGLGGNRPGLRFGHDSARIRRRAIDNRKHAAVRFCFPSPR
jgi:hypothetical protein